MYYLKMNNRRDGFGYIYGHVLDKHQKLEPVRVDLLPSRKEWFGDVMPGHISEDRWQVYLDGNFAVGCTGYTECMNWLADYVEQKNRLVSDD